MSVAEALRAAHAAGIRVEIDGDDLVLEASAAPPSAVLDLLSRHKAGIVTLLRSADDGWSAEDWRVFFDERAGIAEFDGGLPRLQAEAYAFACCATEWLNRPDGGPGDVFTHGAKTGSTIDGLLDDACVLVSLLNRHRVEPGKLAMSMGRLGDGRPASVIGAVVDLMAAANLRKRQEAGEVTR